MEEITCPNCNVDVEREELRRNHLRCTTCGFDLAESKEGQDPAEVDLEDEDDEKADEDDDEKEKADEGEEEDEADKE